MWHKTEQAHWEWIEGAKHPGVSCLSLCFLSQHLWTQSYWHALEGGLASEKLLFWEVGAQICVSWKFPERLGAWSHGKKRSWGPNIPVQTLRVQMTKQVFSFSSPRVPVRLIGAYYILSSVSDKSSSVIRNGSPQSFCHGGFTFSQTAVFLSTSLAWTCFLLKTGTPSHTSIARMTS